MLRRWIWNGVNVIVSQNSMQRRHELIIGIVYSGVYSYLFAYFMKNLARPSFLMTLSTGCVYILHAKMAPGCWTWTGAYKLGVHDTKRDGHSLQTIDFMGVSSRIIGLGIPWKAWITRFFPAVQPINSSRRREEFGGRIWTKEISRGGRISTRVGRSREKRSVAAMLGDSISFFSGSVGILLCIALVCLSKSLWCLAIRDARPPTLVLYGGHCSARNPIKFLGE